MWEDKERMKNQTEEHLESMLMVRMKNFDGSSGMCSHRDDQYILIEDNSDIPLIFNTIDDLSDAGWTID